MTCIFFNSDSLFKPDYLVYDNLINILTRNHVNKGCCLDIETSLLLEQPIRLLSYSNIEQEDEIEEYSKLELSMMVNKLLKERQYLMDLFGKIDQERRKLREDNIKITEQLFFKEDPLNQKNYERFFNRSFGLNYEFTKFFLEKERKSHDNCRILLAKQIEEINDLNSKINKLEKKLLKSRENLKQYLVTGKINPEEITNLGLTSHKMESHQDSTAGVTNENNGIDFSQDWEKISLNSHNSNLIVFNTKKNPALTASGSKPVLNTPQNFPGVKSKMQETKSKIDKFFKTAKAKSPDIFQKKIGNLNNMEKSSDINPISMASHLKINHIESITSNEIKTEKSETNFSTKNIPPKAPPKIINHNNDMKQLSNIRPSSQSKIHLKKNNINEKK